MIRTLVFLCFLLPSTLSAQAERPNFLIIGADDVGMAELGLYGSEIDTPALDALAGEGIRFTNFYAEKLVDYLRSDPEQERPFLAYLNFSAPHIPVQTPDTHIDLYRGRYDDGYDVLREVRLAGMIELGLFPPGTELADRAPTVTPWEELSDEARSIHARRMEVYAGAIHNMDDNIGKVVDYLKQEDLYANTVILFMSDNGAAGFFGYGDGPPAARYAAADNSIDNLGREGSMMFYGPGWGSAGSVPFTLFKRHAAEGGIRVPAIVSGPVVDAGGSISHSVLMVSDVAPTVLELAGVDYPEGTYEGREILPQTGKSLAPLLREPDAVIHGEEEVLGIELWSRIAVRKGDWKLLRTEPPFREDRWCLYNLREDPGETTDLSARMPDKLEEMQAAWEQFRERYNVTLPLSLPNQIRPMWLIDDSPHPDPMP